MAYQETDIKGLQALSLELRKKHHIDYEKALRIAEEQNRPIRQVDEKGTVIQLKGLTKNGQLLYYITDNLNAARTVSAT